MNKLDTQKEKKTETATRTEWKDDLNSSRKSLEPEKPTEEQMKEMVANLNDRTDFEIKIIADRLMDPSRDHKDLAI